MKKIPWIGSLSLLASAAVLASSTSTGAEHALRDYCRADSKGAWRIPREGDFGQLQTARFLNVIDPGERYFELWASYFHREYQFDPHSRIVHTYYDKNDRRVIETRGKGFVYSNTGVVCFAPMASR